MSDQHYCAFCIAKRLVEHGSFDGATGLGRTLSTIRGLPVCAEHVEQALALDDLHTIFDRASVITEHWKPAGNDMGLVPVPMLRNLSRAVAKFDDGRRPAAAAVGSV